ncbi:hypothetical protein GUITHDRAFT_105274 [Guillardia theta CCMP2712]|uniref:Uncharacterized protein n=1 Tax=Guillardia theta (strain CCMP2712) TaxID=905079 RepID=L1JL16_GUITC|nr:hypothetical protein GUITHDRAFT_105274 [Guillardia theta CCMP2712]EKX49198.1 hypothetical protein GUITHDRAFT_105274 [Guillardia theta CCMP2712]|eukprot:XP_005836178.1 hypothetical protein GUITHDRAFT_105274 [Guillardia theta CCMP2712]
MHLRCVGFCGIDDSVDPRLLAAISESYPWVEFASLEWVDDLKFFAEHAKMRLAGHLCSKYVLDLMKGKGFKRFQLNPTKANNVDSSKLTAEMAKNLVKVAADHEDIEFIVQRSTHPQDLMVNGSCPTNVSFLFDESKGRGAVSSQYSPPPPPAVSFGYAGGLGPANIREELKKMEAAAQGRNIWIDMESSLRTILKVIALGLLPDKYSKRARE